MMKPANSSMAGELARKPSTHGFTVRHRQQRVEPGCPAGGRWTTAQSEEPPELGITPPATAANPEAISLDQIPGRLLWEYQGQLWHPEAVVEGLISHHQAPTSLRGMPPNDAIRSFLVSVGANPDGSGVDADPGLPRCARPSVMKAIGRYGTTITGPDLDTITLYRSSQEIPPLLDLVPVSERGRAFYGYADDVHRSAPGVHGVRPDGPKMSDQAYSEVFREAAERWAAIPEWLRDEIVSYQPDYAGLFRFIRRSASGGDSPGSLLGPAAHLADELRDWVTDQDAAGGVKERVLQLNAASGELDSR